MPKKIEKPQKPVFGAGVRQHGRLVFSWVILVLAAFLAVALLSYDPYDPSSNLARDGVVKNLAGVAGSYSAAPLLEVFGAGSFALVLVLFCWAWRLLYLKSFPRWWFRAGCTVLLLIFASMAFSTLDSLFGASDHFKNGYGGFLGRENLQELNNYIPLWLQALTLWPSSLYLFALSAAVPWHYWAHAKDGIKWLLAWGWHLTRLATNGLVWASEWAFYWIQRIVYGVRTSIAELKLRRVEVTGAEPKKPRKFWNVNFIRPPKHELRRQFEESHSITAESIPHHPQPQHSLLEAGEDAEDAVAKANLNAASAPIPNIPQSPNAPTRSLSGGLSAPTKPQNNGPIKLQQESLDITMRDQFQLPPLSLLNMPSQGGKKQIPQSVYARNAELLQKVLADFGVKGKVTEVLPGPVITLYSLEPAPGTKSARVIGLAEDIARSMSAVSARISVVPGKNAIGIELPNEHRDTVYLKELLNHESYKKNKMKLPMCVGKDIGGTPQVMDLAKTPHLLIAGTTGSGKSVGVNAMIISLLYRFTPEECRFIMVDPKMLELSIYEGIPHLLSPVVTDPSKAVVALKWAVKEMERRYKLMSKLSVRNVENFNNKIAEYNKKGAVITQQVQTGFDPDTGKPITEEVPIEMKPMPFIVVIVDEMADLMLVAGKDIEGLIQRLAQMARAAGIHIILATQRPSVDVITGVIKANFPSRISFSVTSKIDSRTILGEQGAEQLLGMGDMLTMAGGNRVTRIHGPFVDDKEVESVVQFWKQQAPPTYEESVTEEEGEASGFEGEVLGAEAGEEQDELYQKAVEAVLQGKKASTSYVQRALRIGYNRAANLIDQMEDAGIISKADHVGRREILLDNEE